MLIEIPGKGKARIVIVGSGFGGIHQPLLYQVATSALEIEEKIDINGNSL